MYDSSQYVKKNLGPFILGSYYGNNMPGIVLGFLDKMIKVKDQNVRWNIAMAFNNSFGNHHSNEAVKYLKILANDSNPVVQRAVKSTLNHLRKRDKSLKLEGII
jgi:HEAT repeat protein